MADLKAFCLSAMRVLIVTSARLSAYLPECLPGCVFECLSVFSAECLCLGNLVFHFMTDVKGMKSGWKCGKNQGLSSCNKKQKQRKTKK